MGDDYFFVLVDEGISGEVAGLTTATSEELVGKERKEEVEMEGNEEGSNDF